MIDRHTPTRRAWLRTAQRPAWADMLGACAIGAAGAILLTLFL